jgi:hypothetical protein
LDKRERIAVALLHGHHEQNALAVTGDIKTRAGDAVEQGRTRPILMDCPLPPISAAIIWLLAR